jgi:hypothetical protein
MPVLRILQCLERRCPALQIRILKWRLDRRDDTFSVYRGKRENATDSPTIWRFSGKDALSSPGVPAVDAFHQLILKAEKQRDANP